MGTKQLVASILTVLFLILLPGCIKEELPPCPVQLTVTLQTVNPADSGAVNDATLYVFDTNGSFIESREVQLNRPEIFTYAEQKPLVFVGWCNTSDEKVTVSPFSAGSNINQGLISLVTRPVMHASPLKFFFSPSDLFYGTKTSSGKAQEENIVVPVSRMTGAMNITVIGLKAFAGYTDNNYSITTGTTPSDINFMGHYNGEPAGYLPFTSFTPTGVFKTETFMLLPTSGETFAIRIYHHNDLVYEADNTTMPLQVEAGKTLNVLIDFTSGTTDANVVIKIVKSEWNEVINWEKIFN